MLIVPDTWLTERLRIVLIGCGGTGSNLADGLMSLGVTLEALGHPGFDLTLHDGDAIALSNVGRQRFCRQDIGLNKATLLAHRLSLFYGRRVHAVPEHYGAQHSRPRDADLFVTATDSAAFRAGFPRLHPYSRALWADVGNDATRGQVVLGSLGDPTRSGYIPNVVDLYPELKDAAFQKAATGTPSCSTEEAIRAQQWPVNRAASQHLLDLLWQLLREGRAAHHGVLFTVSPPSIQTLLATQAQWDTFGWQSARRAAA